MWRVKKFMAHLNPTLLLPMDTIVTESHDEIILTKLEFCTTFAIHTYVYILFYYYYSPFPLSFLSPS